MAKDDPRSSGESMLKVKVVLESDQETVLFKVGELKGATRLPQGLKARTEVTVLYPPA